MKNEGLTIQIDFSDLKYTTLTELKDHLVSQRRYNDAVKIKEYLESGHLTKVLILKNTL